MSQPMTEPAAAPPKYCPHRVRHWRILHGTVGMRAPVCLYCGSPNPKPLTEEEWRELLAHYEDRGFGKINKYVAEAIKAHLKAAEPTKKTFAHADYYSSFSAWGFVDHEGEFMPATHLTGKVVNIGDKNGLTFDSTTVTSFDERTGTLILDGGTYGSWLWPENEPKRPIEKLDLPMHEIARGYIHEEEPGEPSDRQD